MATTDQALVFFGSYAPAERPGIHAYTFDGATGALAPRTAFAGVTKPTFLVVHPNGRWLYAASETSPQSDNLPGSVWAFRFQRDPWEIQLLNQQPTGGDVTCHLEFDATGRWVLASNYGTGSVCVLPILPDGALGEMTDFWQHEGHSVDQRRQLGPHAHSATFVPGSLFVIVADLGLDELVIYQFDPATGKLGAQRDVDTRPGAGPRHIAYHPHKNVVYVANEMDSTMGVYAFDATNGTLHEQQMLDTLPPGAPDNAVADIHVSPSGDRVYISNRGHNSIAVFGAGADGRLARISTPSCGAKWPRNFALAPGGRFMLVANQHSDEVSVLPLLDSALAIGAPVARAAVEKPACVQFA
ncbi:MAG: lactonase family protein [Chloroflexi bacterium]|nr:lactonase family protein [Chloroflexota bacterium]